MCTLQETTLLLLLLYNQSFKELFSRHLIPLYPNLILHVLPLPHPPLSFRKIELALDRSE